MMRRHLPRLSLLLGVLCALQMPLAWGADRVRMIVAGSERGTSAQIARDIAKHVAKPADIEFDLRHSAGSPDTLLRLREGGGLQFAILQADAAEVYLGAAARGNIEAGQLIAPVRFLAPLHAEEIHFIVRSDSPLNFVHEIDKARINLGPPNGGTVLTGTSLYRLMFDTAIPDSQASFLAHPVALVKLTEQALDVVVLVAPQPARLLADMKAEARRFVKLLKLDPTHPGTARVLKTYSATTIPAASYPSLLDEDLPALAIRNYLVSHGRNDALLARFANAWCQHLPQPKAAGNPGPEEAALPVPVSGWLYARAFERELRACLDGKPATPETCSQVDRALGLCG